jgi:hydroxypyruvate reductase
LLKVFQAALQRVAGRACVRRFLAEQESRGPCGIVAIGKAAQSMALGAVDALGSSVGSGLVISKTGHLDYAELESRGLSGIEAEHPVPGEGTFAAGAALLRYIEKGPSDLPLLFLISGGASSLVEVPAPGISVGDVQRTNRWLLGSGLAIGEMNLVRKALSDIKAGRLLAHLGGRVRRGLLISDVPGDDPSVIGSGLLVPDPDLQQRVGRLELPEWLVSLLRRVQWRGAQPVESPPLSIVANLQDALDAAETAARDQGLRVFRHPEFVAGDAAKSGEQLARILLESEPGLHLWGGETTVRLPSSPGTGGRNQHLALAAARVIAGHRGTWFLSGATDGTDGPTEDAGALVDGETLRRAELAGFDADTSLIQADAGTVLAASGDLIYTGPTGTNVMDMMMGLRIDDGRKPADA